MIARRILIAAAAAALAAFPARAQSFMAPAEAARVLADGKPWSVTTGEGRKARITLNRDGSGTFEGPITMPIGWKTDGEDLCIDLKRAGARCLRFKATGAGYDGYRGDKVDLAFARAGR